MSNKEQLSSISFSALKEVQAALACFRDKKPYTHPVHGNISLEELKYLVVDTAIERIKSQIHILPDTNLGYTKKFLFDYLEEFGLVDQFEKWIHGQTTGVDQQNEAIYFTVDVLNFFSELRK
jgi:hypothetical protein